MQISFFIPLFLLFAFDSSALVDYSESVVAPAAKSRSGGGAAPAKKQMVRRVQRPGKSGGGAFANTYFDTSSSYRSLDVVVGSESGKVNILNFDGHFQTPYNIYLDINYWTASTSLQSISDSSRYQAGNPKFILGFNWLQFGKSSEMATIDLYGGLAVKGSSDLAKSSSDKIVGIQTTKRFYQFALGLGYEVTLVGTPHDFLETQTGNIQKLSGTLGWMVSADIRFLLEGSLISINQSDDLTRFSRLNEKISIASLTPRIILGITPMVKFELGGVFRTRKVRDNSLLAGTRLWSLEGLYGNSIFTGLSFTL